MVDVIRELGHLEKLAKEDKTRRFNRLYRLLRRELFLVIAKQRIAKVMRKHYGRDPKTGCKALFVYKPGKPPSLKTQYSIWPKTPRRLTLFSPLARQVEDKQVFINTDWARGRSIHQRQETRANANNTCQSCGATGVSLFVHHPNSMGKAKRVKKGAAHVAKSGMAPQTKLLCRPCHLVHHHNNTRQ